MVAVDTLLVALTTEEEDDFLSGADILEEAGVAGGFSAGADRLEEPDEFSAGADTLEDADDFLADADDFLAGAENLEETNSLLSSW